MQRLNTRRAFFLSLTALCAVSTFAAPPLDLNHPSVRSAIARQNDATPKLMKTPGVLGTAVGLDANGTPTLVVYVDVNHPGAKGLGRIPGAEVILTEKFRAGGPKPTATPNGVSHTAKQPVPISLGTSGGWRSDLANGYCCGGTLGSLVQVNGVKFILSNYHVLEADTVLGGNNKQAITGDPVIQPGLIDVGCNANNAQNVGTLRVVNSLPNSNVDVGLAEITPGAVSENGAILNIGTISASTLAPALNMQVKKAGRTSGLTRSRINGLNATINISYENECAGGHAFTKTFTGQIVVAKGATFLKGGDSGSLMVEDSNTNPRAVGLLYAGSSQVAIANPISDVLSFIGPAIGGVGATATMVGQ
jgi:hypothetical protein